VVEIPAGADPGRACFDMMDNYPCAQEVSVFFKPTLRGASDVARTCDGAHQDESIYYSEINDTVLTPQQWLDLQQCDVPLSAIEFQDRVRCLLPFPVSTKAPPNPFMNTTMKPFEPKTGLNDYYLSAIVIGSVMAPFIIGLAIVLTCQIVKLIRDYRKNDSYSFSQNRPRALPQPRPRLVEEPIYDDTVVVPPRPAEATKIELKPVYENIAPAPSSTTQETTI